MVKTEGLWHLNYLLSFRTFLPVQCDRVSIPGWCSQEDSAPLSLPCPQSWAMVSAQEVQAIRIPHSLQLCVTEALFQARAEIWAHFFYSAPTQGRDYPSINGQEYWVSIPLTQLTHRASQIQSYTADFLSEAQRPEGCEITHPKH